ncbi:MAG: glycosyltransferase family 2 protein [Patescibacteria group bacterium]|nr:glycosyltransferase family 2 protein [Patescibacteria group bacterium]
MASKRNLSVVILNYNTGDYLIKCLKSLMAAKEEADMDIWVVDNNSSDDSLQKAQKLFPKLNYILNQENVGFTKGNNLALRQVKSEYILILNPDTEVLPKTLETLLDYLENHPQVGAISPKVELSDGSLDWASHRGFPTPLASLLYYVFKNDSLYHLTNRDFSQPHEVDSLTGAFILTKKEVLDKVGLFDEEYYMYADDIDLCFRIKKAGYKIIYFSKVKIIHYKGISSGIKKHSEGLTTADFTAKLRSVNAFYETMKIFYRKNLAGHYPFFVNWLVFLGINTRWSLAKRKLKV